MKNLMFVMVALVVVNAIGCNDQPSSVQYRGMGQEVAPPSSPSVKYRNLKEQPTLLLGNWGELEITQGDRAIAAGINPEWGDSMDLDKASIVASSTMGDGTSISFVTAIQMRVQKSPIMDVGVWKDTDGNYYLFRRVEEVNFKIGEVRMPEINSNVLECRIIELPNNTELGPWTTFRRST